MTSAYEPGMIPQFERHDRMSKAHRYDSSQRRVSSLIDTASHTRVRHHIVTTTRSADDVVFTAEVAQMFGVTPSGISRMVKRGALTPVKRAPGTRGALMFRRSEVEALAAERAR